MEKFIYKVPNSNAIDEGYNILKQINKELLANNKDTIEILIAAGYDRQMILNYLCENSSILYYEENFDSLVYVMRYLDFLIEKFQNIEFKGMSNFDSDIIKSKEPTSINRETLKI